MVFYRSSNGGGGSSDSYKIVFGYRFTTNDFAAKTATLEAGKKYLLTWENWSYPSKRAELYLLANGEATKISELNAAVPTVRLTITSISNTSVTFKQNVTNFSSSGVIIEIG